MYYLVSHRGQFYRETEKPVELPDGNLKLKSGQAFAKGTWTVRDMHGQAHPFARASTATPTGRPARKSPAGARRP